MVVTADQAVDIIQNQGKMEKYLDAIHASEKAEQDFHRLAKECLR